MATIEARYLASLVLDEADQASDMGILATSVLRLLYPDESMPTPAVLAEVLERKFGEHNVPAWD